MSWLRFVSRTGLGACLADDMGLGKTMQVIGLLLRPQSRTQGNARSGRPSLLVVPASLMANWKAELAAVRPRLSFADRPSLRERQWQAHDREIGRRGDWSYLIITTYGMLVRTRLAASESDWDLVILDEAQAIKNSGTRQTRAVKELKAPAGSP